MVLHREDGLLTVLHSFDRTVIEVEMGHFKWLRARDGPGVAAHREPVVLRRYKHLSCREIAHWMVAPPMPVRQLTVPPPNARPSSWWPRQIPKIGSVPSASSRSVAIA